MLTSNLYMSIVSRLAEPEARKIIFEKADAQETGVTSLQRASSVVNVSAAQSLIADEFSIMFREFHEFILVGGKLSKFLDLKMISEYQAAGEVFDYIQNNMPKIVNEVMHKIITGVKPDKSDKEVSPDDIKLIDTTDKKEGEESKEESKDEAPKKKKQVKLYDPMKYTTE